MQVLDLVASHVHIFDRIHVGAAFVQLERTASPSIGVAALADEPRFFMLMAHAKALMDSQDHDAQMFSNMIHACARLQIKLLTDWEMLKKHALIGDAERCAASRAGAGRRLRPAVPLRSANTHNRWPRRQ